MNAAGDTPNRRASARACRALIVLLPLRIALTGKADFLVTADGDLLALGRRFARPIVTAEQFLQTLGSSA